MKYQAPRGTLDTLPDESWKWQTIERIARTTAGLFHFAEIRTPMFEATELFHRGVGEGSDIVRKETFTFDDRGGRSITLRPEGTAGVVRAVIEGGLLNQDGARVKVFYLAPNFRYERPEKGRLRQHHQFGAEAFGVAAPAQDVECILLQLDFYRRCGLKDLALQINSLGDKDSKARYRQALVDYLTPRQAELGADSQRRLVENPLRILDSKDPADQAAVKDAPPAAESLSDKSRKHFDAVQQLLTDANVAYTVNPRLVRGFDYYTDTLWEVTAAGLGSQNAVGGGGRYDGLVEDLGGRSTPGVGFGSGLERLLIALEQQKVAIADSRQPLVYLISVGDAARSANWKLAAELRAADISVDLDLAGRPTRSQFTLADRDKAAVALVLGDNELANNTVAMKDLATGQQTIVPRGELVGALQSRLMRRQQAF